MAVVMFAIQCLLWGTTWMCIKIGLNDFPPLLFAGARFLAAALIMFLILVWKKERIIWEWKALSPSVVFGILNAFSFAFVFWGEQFLSSSLTAIINATVPFFSAIFAHFLVGERLNWFKVSALTVGFSGIFLIFGTNLGSSAFSEIWGELAIIGAAACYAMAGVHLKRNHTAMNPIPAVTVQMGVTAVPLLLVGLPLEAGSRITISWPGVASFLFLVLLGSVAAFLIYYYLVQKMEISKVSYVSMFTPVVAAVNGVVWLHEPMKWQLVAGFGLVAAGMIVLNSFGDFRRSRVAGGMEVKGGGRTGFFGGGR